MANENRDDQAERTVVCRTIAQEFRLTEAAVAGAVYLASDWLGEAQPGAVISAQTGDVLPRSDTETIAQSWMNVNDRLEEQGIDLYYEIKSACVTTLYRFA